MDIFEKRYYKTSTIFLKFLGLWPYQRKLFRRMTLFIWYLLVLSILIPMIRGIIKGWNEKMYYIVAENIGFGIFLISNTSKFTAVHFSCAQLQLLTKSIANNWQIIKHYEEREILKHYTNFGFKLNLAFQVYLFGVVSVFIILPYFSYFLDFAFPLQNGTHLQYKLLYLYYGFIDENQYHNWISMHTILVVLIHSIFLCGVDSIFMLSIHHTCAQFAITSHRLLNIKKHYGKDKFENLPDKETMIYHNLVRSIKLHIESLSGCTQLEDCFSLAFLIENNFSTLGLNICVIHIMKCAASLVTVLTSILKK